MPIFPINSTHELAEAKRMLETLYKAANLSHSAVELDAGLLALTLWMVDSGGGDVLACMAVKKTDRGVVGARCLKIVYRQGNTGEGIFWDANGAQQQAEFVRALTAELEEGEETSTLMVAMVNLPAFAAEWGSRISIDSAMKLISVGQVQRWPSADTLDSFRSTMPAWLKWADHPFIDQGFPEIAIASARTDALRQVILTASESDQIHYVKAAVRLSRLDWVQSFLDHRYPVEKMALMGSSSVEVIELARKRGFDVAGHVYAHGQTLLHVSESPPAIEHLLQCGADMLAPDRLGHTPLHRNLESSDVIRKTSPETVLGRIKAAGIMIDAGASPFHVPEQADLKYLTPFQHAVKYGAVEQVAALVDAFAIDLGQRTLAGRTLMQLCGNNSEMKQFLRAAKAEASISGAVAAQGAGAVALERQRLSGPEVI
jgi:hypothetical protein